MKTFYVFLLICNFRVFGAMVREFATIFNDTEENVTSFEYMSTVTEEIINLIEENTQLEDTMDENLTWNSSAIPIFSALRNFWEQASSNLLEPIPDEDLNNQNVHFLKTIEHGLVEAVEATTMLFSQMDEAPQNKLEAKQQAGAKNRQGDLARESDVNLNPQKRRKAFNLMANISESCGSCYENLQNCVQKCFVQHNCHDIQRGVRICPPAPNRMCNPFTQWNPVDECQIDSDCKSPLLCCNDGCINKCMPGVWKS